MQPIVFAEFLERINISQETLALPNSEKIQQVVSPRDMAKVDLVVAMPTRYLQGLLLNVSLIGSPKIKVFTDCQVYLMRFDPAQLFIGQRYVYRKKYISILENFENLFEGFLITRGISKLTAFIILGRDRQGILSLAHYIPPLVERHNNELLLMDGIHRNFITRRSGTTIESIFIDKVRVPFPCEAVPWEKIIVTDLKPDKKEDRFFNLRSELFRDLEFVGIDG